MLFFVRTMYLILAGMVSAWFYLPGLGDIGFTVAFVLFSLLHCAVFAGPAKTGILFAASAVVSFVMEEAGVRTGLIYGRYHYGDLLGIKLGHVPVFIPLAWFMMVYPCWIVARALVGDLRLPRLPQVLATASVAALVMTAWDVVMDPGMAAAGNWIWEDGGAYFGVPRRNYLGWLVTTFLIYLVFGWLWRGQPGNHSTTVADRRSSARLFAELPVAVYAFFALR